MVFYMKPHIMQQKHCGGRRCLRAVETMPTFRLHKSDFQNRPASSSLSMIAITGSPSGVKEGSEHRNRSATILSISVCESACELPTAALRAMDRARGSRKDCSSNERPCDASSAMPSTTSTELTPESGAGTALMLQFVRAVRLRPKP